MGTSWGTVCAGPGQTLVSISRHLQTGSLCANWVWGKGVSSCLPPSLQGPQLGWHGGLRGLRGHPGRSPGTHSGGRGPDPAPATRKSPSQPG